MFYTPLGMTMHRVQICPQYYVACRTSRLNVNGAVLRDQVLLKSSGAHVTCHSRCVTIKKGAEPSLTYCGPNNTCMQQSPCESNILELDTKQQSNKG